MRPSNCSYLLDKEKTMSKRTTVHVSARAASCVESGRYDLFCHQDWLVSAYQTGVNDDGEEFTIDRSDALLNGIRKREEWQRDNPSEKITIHENHVVLGKRAKANFTVDINKPTINGRLNEYGRRCVAAYLIGKSMIKLCQEIIHEDPLMSNCRVVVDIQYPMAVMQAESNAGKAVLKRRRSEIVLDISTLFLVLTTFVIVPLTTPYASTTTITWMEITVLAVELLALSATIAAIIIHHRADVNATLAIAEAAAAYDPYRSI